MRFFFRIFFIILLCGIVPAPILFAASPTTDRAAGSGIQPFGEFNWTDNLTLAITKLNKMGFDNVSLSGSHYAVSTPIVLSGISNSDIAAKLIKESLYKDYENRDGVREMKEISKDNGLFFNIGSLVIKGESVLIAGTPFNIQLTFDQSPGYYIKFPETAIEIVDNGGSKGIISYTISTITLCDISENQNKGKTYNSVLNLLDRKYKVYRPSDEQIAKTIKVNYSAYAKINKIKIDKRMIDNAIQAELNKDKIYTDSSGTQIILSKSDVYNNPGACFTYSVKNSIIPYLDAVYAEYLKKTEINNIKTKFKGKKDMSDNL